MASENAEWRPSGPAVCRCCFAEGCYKDISTEYFWMGKREVYAEMLDETFNVTIAFSKWNGPNSTSRLICEACISRLRDASEFKKQVAECERTFMQHLDPGSSSTQLEAVGTTLENLKVETVKEERLLDSDDFDDRLGFDDDDDMDQPLVSLATKVPKKEVEDVLELLKGTDVVVKKRKSVIKLKEAPAKRPKPQKARAPPPPPAPKAEKVVKKKKGAEVASEASGGKLSVEERRNVAMLLANTTALPFISGRGYYKCFFCEEVYSYLETFLQHSRSHDALEYSKIYKMLNGRRAVKVDISHLECKICRRPFTDYFGIREHLVKDHDKRFNGANTGVVAYNLTIRDGHLECHVCQKRFHTFVLLNRHMNVHFRNAICETCGAAFMTHKRLSEHVKIHISGGFPCDKCPKKYTNLASLKYHKEYVHEGKPKKRALKCTHCSERFTHHRNKLAHLKQVHGVTFEFDCEICRESFGSRRALTSHTYKHHSRVTECEYCGRCFSTMSDLRNHLISHTGEKRFVCSVCQKAYCTNKSLKRHTENQHFVQNPYKVEVSE